MFGVMFGVWFSFDSAAGKGCLMEMKKSWELQDLVQADVCAGSHWFLLSGNVLVVVVRLFCWSSSITTDSGFEYSLKITQTCLTYLFSDIPAFSWRTFFFKLLITLYFPSKPRLLVVFKCHLYQYVTRFSDGLLKVFFEFWLFFFLLISCPVFVHDHMILFSVYARGKVLNKNEGWKSKYGDQSNPRADEQYLKVM